MRPVLTRGSRLSCNSVLRRKVHNHRLHRLFGLVFREALGLWGLGLHRLNLFLVLHELTRIHFLHLGDRQVSHRGADQLTGWLSTWFRGH